MSLFLTGTGYTFRTTVAEMILSSQHRELAKYTFLSEDELDDILYKIQNPVFENTEYKKEDTLVEVVEEEEEDNGESTPQTEPTKPKPKKIRVIDKKLVIKVENIEKYYGPTSFYKGKVIEISNPSYVKVVTSQVKNHGEQIFVQAKRAGALAAVNASGFVDVNGVGNGGVATGIVIENGKVKKGGNKAELVAAITKDGRLLTGKYTTKQLLEKNVVSAAGFKPQLIANGKKLIKGEGGWGIGPRTAMGQKKDGTIVLVVIDGRQPTRSMGATLREVQDILYDRGVINAMSMDGGSSSSMYFNGKNVTTPSSVGNVPRYLPNIWAVVPGNNKNFEVFVDGKKKNPSSLRY